MKCKTESLKLANIGVTQNSKELSDLFMYEVVKTLKTESKINDSLLKKYCCKH